MAYTSLDEIRLFLGPKGVDLRLDDLNNPNSAIARILSYVDGTINRYLDQIYDRTNLVGVAWVRDRATVLACNLLSQRRGNDGLFNDEVTRIHEELADIRAGNTFVPAAKVNTQQVPSVRAQQVNLNDWTHPLQTDQEFSTGGGYDGEHVGFGLSYF